MMVLYDEQEILRSYIESEIEEATREARQKATREGIREGILEGKHEGMYNEKIETAKRMLKDGTLPIDKIAEFTSLSIEKIQELINIL